MTLLDEAPSAAEAPPPPAPGRRRWVRRAIVTALVLAIPVTLLVLSALGVGDASAAGGCGGG